MARKPTTAGLLIAAAVAAVAPFTAGHEGLVTHPYRDPAGILTVCYGETQGIKQRAYTPAECAQMLRMDQSHTYAPAILKCVPTLNDMRRIMPMEAALDASYNAGVSAFCRSPMAAQFRAGRWQAGCAAFIGWYETAKGRRLPGLVQRRRDEANLCLKGS